MEGQSSRFSQNTSTESRPSKLLLWKEVWARDRKAAAGEPHAISPIHRFPGPHATAGPQNLAFGDQNISSGRQSQDTQRQSQVSQSDGRTSRLWAAAYDQVKLTQPELVTRYEDIVSRYRTRQDDPSSELEEINDDITVASYQEVQHSSPGPMDKVLRAWFAQQSAATSANKGWSKIALLLQDTWEKTPQVSLPWVTLCLAVQTAFDSSSTLPPKALSIIIFIFARMDWYCLLEDLPHSQVTPRHHQDTVPAFETALVNLYRTVLHCCISIACYRGDHHEIDVADLKFDRSDFLLKEALPADAYGSRNELLLKQLFEDADVLVGPDPSDDDKVKGQAQITGAQGAKYEAKENAPRPAIDRSSIQVEHYPDTRALHSQLLPDIPGLDEIGVWLSNTPQFSRFRDWESDSSGQGLLWVSGGPGSGKTTILTAIVQRLLHERKSDSKKVYFAFCGGGSRNPDSPTSAMARIIEQILEEQPKLQKYFDEANQYSRGQGTVNHRPAFSTMSKILYSMTKDEKFLPAYFILDSVDECSIDDTGDHVPGHALDQLSALISVTTERSDRVRWLVSLDSESVKDRVKEHELHVNLDSNLSALQPLAERRIAASIRDLTRDSRGKSKPPTGVKAEILDKSSGNFLWLTLAFRVMKSYGTPWNIRHILEELPRGLQALYQHALYGMTVLPWNDGEYCGRILQLTAVACRPLRIGELKDLTNLPPELDLARFIEKRCFAFLKVTKEDEVYFQHRSAREFLLAENEDNISKSHLHAEVMKSCTDFLANFFKSGRNAGLISNHYATLYWMQHFSQADRPNDSSVTTRMTLEFLDGCFLPWLESLVSNENLSRALALLMRLQQALKTRQPGLTRNLCLDLVRDAARVLHLHRGASDQNDIQIRNSLLFYRGSRDIRAHYMPSEYPWLAQAPNIGQYSSPQRFALKGHTDWTRSCDYSPDGRFVASASDDGTIRMWDSQTGELEDVLNHDGWIYRVVHSTQGLIAGMGSDAIALWDATTHIRRHRLQPRDLGDDYVTQYFTDIAFSRDGSRLAAVIDSRVVVWTIPSFEHVVWETGDLGISYVTFSGDGSLLAVVGYVDSSCRVALLDTREGKVTRSFHGAEGLRNPLFSPDSRYLAVGSYDSPYCFYVWDLDSEEDEPMTFPGHSDSVRTVSFSLDGKRIASGSDDQEIRIWDLDKGASEEPMRVIKTDGGAILWLTFSPTSPHHLATASRDGIIRLWDIDSVDPTFEDSQPMQHSNSINFVTLSPDDKTIASGCEGGRIFLWDGETGFFRQELPGSRNESSDDSGSESGATRPAHDGQVLRLAFSPDSSKLLSTATDSTIFLWNVQEGKHIREMKGHRDWVRSAVFSPDGVQVASASDDRTVRLWDVVPVEKQDADEAQQESKCFAGFSDYVFCVTFSQDGRYLAAGGDDSYIRVRDLRLGLGLDQDYLGEEVGPCQPTRSLAFFPDGDRIVAASNTREMKIWNWRSAQCLYTFNAKAKKLRSLVFFGNLTDYILTEMGAQLLPTSAGRPLPQPSWCSYGVHRDDEQDSYWITYKDGKLVYLPKQYRPSSDGISPVCVSRYKVIIACESGAVLLFRFKEGAIPDLQVKDSLLQVHEKDRIIQDRPKRNRRVDQAKIHDIRSRVTLT